MNTSGNVHTFEFHANAKRRHLSISPYLLFLSRAQQRKMWAHAHANDKDALHKFCLICF